MTGTKAKSTISNTGGGKTVFGAWPNHVSGCQNNRLGAASYQYAAARAVKADKRLGEPLWVILLCQKAIQMGNAG